MALLAKPGNNVLLLFQEEQNCEGLTSFLKQIVGNEGKISIQNLSKFETSKWNQWMVSIVWIIT